MTDLPRQKHPKLKDFDYSTPGRYFVTLCVKNRGETLSAISEQVVGLFDPKRPHGVMRPYNKHKKLIF